MRVAQCHGTVEFTIRRGGHAEHGGMLPGDVLTPLRVDGVVGVIQNVDVLRQHLQAEQKGIRVIPVAHFACFWILSR